MSEFYEMAFTAMVGVAVLYAITKNDKQPTPTPIRYEAPANRRQTNEPVVPTVIPPREQTSSKPVAATEREASPPLPQTPIRNGHSNNEQVAPFHMETPSWMTREPSFFQQQQHAEEQQPSRAVAAAPVPAAPIVAAIPLRQIVEDELPSWISSAPVTSEFGSPTWMSAREVSHQMEPLAAKILAKKSSGEQHVPPTSTCTVGELKSVNEQVSHIALMESDAVFVYPLANSQFLGDSLRHEKKRVHFIETRAGAGEIALGCAAAASAGGNGLNGRGRGKRVSILLSSHSIRPMLPAMKRMVQDKIPVAFHISLLHQQEGEEENASIIASSHEALAAIKALPHAIILVSNTSMEAEEMANKAIHLSQELSIPVFHVFDHIELNSLIKVQQHVASHAHTHAHVPIAPFHYSGSKSAKVVLIAMGHAASEVESFVHQQHKSSLGCIRVRVLRPWSNKDLLQVLPHQVERICVLDQTGEALSLFSDVASSFANSKSSSHVQVSFVKVLPTCRGVTVQLIQSACNELGVVEGSVNAASTSANTKTVVIFGEANYRANTSGVLVKEVNRIATYVDYFANVSMTEIRLGNSSMVQANQANIVALFGNVETLVDSGIDLLSPLVNDGGGIVLLPSSFSDQVPPSLLKKIKLKNARVIRYHAEANCSPVTSALNLLHGSNGNSNGGICNDHTHHHDDMTSTHSNITMNRVLIKGDVFSSTGNGETSEQSFNNGEQVNLEATTFFGLIPRLDFIHDVNPQQDHEATLLNSSSMIASNKGEKEFEMIARHEIAWNLLFKDAFETTSGGVENNSSSSHKEEIFQVKLVLRKRLTPLSYDRNIFHLEFDISGTRLKYNIGDALGVFAHNNVQEVDEFISKYGSGLDANAFVAFNSSEGSKGSTSEFVSVRNLLIQHLDLFGRPNKKFYLWLSQFATSKYEKLKLSHAGTDDAEAFKLGVSETVTFADLLLTHPSARPGMEDLMTVIPKIKARHYSIASSMKFSPKSVSLLIVEVDWKTPLGKVRHGQCTRYLANLQVGSTVRVDVVPSVLRLPPNPEQPIVMAGLGTGMAPFRAFVQERKIQKESGMKVGPIVLYFGARHRSEEWLYGEEWDKYLAEGLVTRLGLAFSRDQKEKIYIQHRIQEDANLLHNLFVKQEGYFYLCGPTWPVPDVRDAVAMGLDPENARQGNVEIVEKLKEQGRYILEVY